MLELDRVCTGNTVGDRRLFFFFHSHSGTTLDLMSAVVQAHGLFMQTQFIVISESLATLAIMY